MTDKHAPGPSNKDIVHEINNPLSFVISNIEMLCKYVQILNKTIGDQSEIIELSQKDFSMNAKKLYEEMNRNHEKEELSFVLSDCEELLKESQDGLRKIKKLLQEFNNKN